MKYYSLLTSFLVSTSILTLSTTEARPLQLEQQAQATIDYCTGFNYEDYITEYDNHEPVDVVGPRYWGEHPILWKHIIRPQIDFNPMTFSDETGYLNFDGTPDLLNIQLGDAARLNQYEESGAFTQDGITVDPPGYWLETIIDDAETTAIFAAMSIWAWNTPVYINFSTAASNVITRVGIIDCVTLTTPSGPPHEVCEWDVDADFIELIEACEGLIIESIKMTYYSDSLLRRDFPEIYYVDGPTLDAESFELDFDNFSSQYEHVVLYDPPPTANIDIEAWVAASQRLAATVASRTRDGQLIQQR